MVHIWHDTVVCYMINNTVNIYKKHNVNYFVFLSDI